MPELGNSLIFSQVDANNNSGTMPSWSGSAAPSTLDDAGRAFQGAVTREWNWRNFTLSAGGSADTKTLTYSTAPAAYYNGQRFAFIANTTNTGSATLNVNSLGAKTIKKDVSGTLTNLSASDMVSGMFVEVAYNTANDCFVWVNRSPALGALATLNTVGTSQIDDSAVTTAKIANNAVDGTKIALGSDAQGDVMYYSGTDWARLAAGTSGQFLKTNGAGSNPAWADAASGGHTLLGTISTASGTSNALGSLTLTNYKFIRLVFNGVSHGGGTTKAILLNGVTVTASVVASVSLYGFVDVDLSNSVASTTVGTDTVAAIGGAATTVTTATTTLTMTTTAGVSFDGGSITVYGLE